MPDSPFTVSILLPNGNNHVRECRMVSIYPNGDWPTEPTLIMYPVGNGPSQRVPLRYVECITIRNK